MVPKKEKIPRPPKGKEKPELEKKNSFFVPLLLIISVALCFLFLLYRKVNQILISGKSLIPVLTLPVSKPMIPSLPTDSLDNQMNNLLASSTGLWRIYAQVSAINHQPFTYSRGSSQELMDYQARLLAMPPSTSTDGASGLPEGLKITQLEDQASGVFAYLINLPDKTVYICLQLQNQTPSSLSLIPKIVSTLYWSLVAQF